MPRIRDLVFLFFLFGGGKGKRGEGRRGSKEGGFTSLMPPALRASISSNRASVQGVGFEWGRGRGVVTGRRRGMVVRVRRGRCILLVLWFGGFEGGMDGWMEILWGEVR